MATKRKRADGRYRNDPHAAPISKPIKPDDTAAISTPELAARAAGVRDSVAYKDACSRMLRWHLYCRDPFNEHGRNGLQEPATLIVHWLPAERFPELMMVPGNIIPLCESCKARVEEVLDG